MTKQQAVNLGDKAAQDREITIVDGDTYNFGNSSNFSSQISDVLGNIANNQEMEDFFLEAVAGNLDGVAIAGVDCSGYTVTFTTTNRHGEEVVDTLRVNVDLSTYDENPHGGNVGDNRESFNVISATDNGKANKIIGTSKNYVDDELGKVGGIKDLVGGSAKGENDYKALLEAALDSSDPRVTLLDVNPAENSFAIQIHRNDVTDTFLVKDATFIEEVLASTLGTSELVNPGNTSDQFVFVTAEDIENNVKVGFGANGVDNPGEPQFGSNINAGELADIVANADDWADVNVTESGGLTQIALTDDSTDVITVVTDDLLFA